MTEEAFERCGFGGQIAHQRWPQYDEAKCVDSTVELPVQVNGKLRGRIVVPFDSENEVVLEAAKNDEKVAQAISGKTIVKEIVIKNLSTKKASGPHGFTHKFYQRFKDKTNTSVI